MSKTKWNSDLTHSELGFRIKHLMITNVAGSFKNFNVSVETNGEDFSTAAVRASVDVNSVYTNNEQRDQHLRASDFFEADKYPQFAFQSTQVEKKDEENFLIHGNLTMKGVTKPVALTAEFAGVTKDPWGGQRAGFTISAKLNRTEWGINFNGVLETGGLVLGEDVKLLGEIQLVKEVVAVPA